MIKKINDIHIKELDALRFVAILFVIINHLGSKPELYNWSVVIVATSPVMAIISSFLLFRSLGHPRELIHKINHRFKSLILPYFLWTFLMFIIYQSIKTVNYISNSNALTMNRPFPTWSFYEYWIHFVILPTPGSFWYLQNLICILPFTFIIYYLIKKKQSIFYLIIVIIIYNHFNIVPYFSDRFLPYYLCGAWLGLHYSKGFPILNINRYLLLISSISLLVISESIPANLGIYKFTIIFFTQIGIFIFGVSTIHQFNNTLVVKYFYNKMDISFYLHASHILFILIFTNTIFIILKYFKIINIYNVYIQIISPFIVFYLTYKSIELLANQMRERIPKLYSALSGGR